MAVERPLGLSLVVMKAVAVAMLVAAATIAPSARIPAPMDPVMASVVDREWDDAAANVQPQPAVELRVAVPTPAPTETLPPTDTALPAVDSRH